MAKVGLNFSATRTGTTGTESDTYCNCATDGSSGDDYPTTRGGFTFGMTDRGTGYPKGRDRVETGDQRLRGIFFIEDPNTRNIRIDKTGAQKIRVAVGDASSAHISVTIDIRDSGGSKFTVTDASIGSAAFVDASSTERADAATWASSNTQSSEYTFTDYVLVRMTAGNACPLAHVEVEEGSAPASVVPQIVHHRKMQGIA